MDQFMYRIKETGRAPTNFTKEQSQVSSKVKLCGYLKKKRNKVGGWRKMWFVLQDKLLLSYGSKEEYDNKLVSFKDVLNLVPGTLVRPLGGFRFTIETTSQALYTFHCDDRSAYREWITMLLDNLATQPCVAQEKFSHRFCNISLDNIPNALRSTTSKLNRDIITHSFDAISQVEHGVTASAACVHLPIAHNTAKILERNGVNSTELHTNTVICNRKSNPIRAQFGGQHFRPHNINTQSSVLAVRQPNFLAQSQIAAETKFDEENFGLYPRNVAKEEIHHREGEQNQNFNCYKCESIHENSAKIEMPISCKQECQAVGLVKDRIQHMSIKGSKEGSMDQHETTKVNTTTSEEEIIMQKETPHRVQAYTRNKHIPVEPIYAVVDLKNKYAHRKLRYFNTEVKRCNSYDSIIQNFNEPAKELRSEKSISLTADDIEGIYEDGESFHVNGTLKSTLKSDEENIYEPINVPSEQSNIIWKCLTRLKVNSFLQLSRMRKYSTSSYDSIKPTPVVQPNSHFSSIKHKFGAHRRSIQVRMRKFCARAYEPNPIFKHNQQSAHGTAVPTSSPCASNNNSCKIKSKYRWKSVKIRTNNVNSFKNDMKAEKRFFGSLPRLRKSRVTLFTSNHIQQEGDSNTNANGIN